MTPRLSLAQQTTHPIPTPICIDGGQVSPAPLPAQIIQALQVLETMDRQNAPLLRLPQTTADLREIEAHARRIREHSDTLVLVGIGGSCLGAQALTAIADSSDPMRLHVRDNPDPASMESLLSQCNPVRTSWLFVSNSGSTLETLSQILLILHWLEKRIGKHNITERCLVITARGESPLRTLAELYRLPVLLHEELGGRWASLSTIGLLPAACCGIEIRRCLKGAKDMASHALTSGPESNQPLQGAWFAFTHYRQGRPVHVMMPYTDRLDFTPWYCQLVSESLGKNGKGITPLAARGANDQHSMLQLMLGGPDDKFFTLVTSNPAGKGRKVDAALAEACGLGYLADQPLGNILAAFQEGTLGSLQAAGRPVRHIHLPEINPYNMGALLMYFMLETLYLAQLMEVNPFNQPAVEDSKIRAKFILRNN